MTRSTTTDTRSIVFKPQQLISNERSKSKLIADQINTFLEDNPESQQITHQLTDEIVNDPILKTDTDYYDLTKAQEREITAKKISRLSIYMEKDIKTARNHFKDTDLIQKLQADENGELPELTNKDLAFFDKRLSLIGNIDPQLSTRVGVHLGLFGNCIKGNGTPQQIKYWLQTRGAVMLKGIYGCFAMTELGHGSNVANLQTKAIYNLQNDTFTIVTPDLTATKWWIGGAASSATHSVVYARLIVKGTDYGVKTFVVPLRDLSTFQLLPGVIIGDIGKKMGRDGIDNGWIQFKNVIIPREFMLSRFAKVIPNDTKTDVTVKIDKNLDSISGYSALLSGRVNMVMDSFRFGSKFVTVATRYAVGRQQFKSENSPDETQLIDYPLHQYRVLPQLAIVYLIAPAAHNLMKTYYSTLDELYAATSSNNRDPKALKKVSHKLKNLFISSASLKATNTWLVASLIDELRQSCGGHGYSQYNGFGKGYNDWVVQCTWEGDNNILSLTSAKSILKKFADASTKGKFNADLDSDSFHYLDPMFLQRVYTNQLTASLDDDNMESYYEAWSIMLVQLLIHVGKTIQATKAFDKITKLLVLIAKFHAIHTMLKVYYEKLNCSDVSFIKDNATKETMWNVYKLFSVYFIDKHSGEFQQFGVFKSKDISNIIQPRLFNLLSIIRKDCIKLTDAFELPDEMLNAPIGYFDGDIYHNYFNEVLKNNPPEKDGPGVPPYYETLTKMLNRGYEFDARLGGAMNLETLEKLK
ncbi:hypothetical protein KAFR_0F04110 [Kazachstania africana CBS 2517]|uniref:Acyl-coenzyme A oxidase n=1 Tax=Kazachstania africana (strain ATCC 22294 / BCRC 22015 / CBS 2517 / CECT 1963 / NBRC 1671 / NRRL Y-8276) TaxID=1071382 RepID=H2AXA6_KAZAF|nr:hypothetical protein KAFR_0F04110 [Kazachstania africana CBS 2517]CCF59006.1 hypothetical protein KAFR_0F04110 [Kazachstania africana CBS 2517]